MGIVLWPCAFRKNMYHKTLPLVPSQSCFLSSLYNSYILHFLIWRIFCSLVWTVSFSSWSKNSGKLHYHKASVHWHCHLQKIVVVSALGSGVQTFTNYNHDIFIENICKPHWGWKKAKALTSTEMQWWICVTASAVSLTWSTVYVYFHKKLLKWWHTLLNLTGCEISRCLESRMSKLVCTLNSLAQGGYNVNSC